MTTPSHHRKLKGIVVSDKMDKTVVVRVDRIASHPKYKKQYTVSTKFHAHDPKNEYTTGDAVQIEETRPLSATKRWKVISKI